LEQKSRFLGTNLGQVHRKHRARMNHLGWVGSDTGFNLNRGNREEFAVFPLFPAGP